MKSHDFKSDEKYIGDVTNDSPYFGLTSEVSPITPPQTLKDAKNGVSTISAHTQDEAQHWYALRCTYGRESKANDYLAAHGIKTFYPTLRTTKLKDGKRITQTESYIPNIFFAHGTEDEIKFFVYDNVNLPFLRFYYSHTRLGDKIVKTPLTVPDKQMESLRIICACENDDIILTTEVLTRFREGQRVRITDGKFKGVEGIVARYQNQQRVGIIINGLLTACTAYVPKGFLKEV